MTFRVTMCGATILLPRFRTDSPVEGDGFEPSVPGKQVTLIEAAVRRLWRFSFREWGREFESPSSASTSVSAAFA